MRINDFDLYKDLLKKKSGLTLTPDKSYLIDSRLTPVAKKWGHASLDDMTVILRGTPDPDLIKDVVEAMTTNETSFFRDTKPFDMFNNTVLPYMMKKRATKKSINIWCAAASSGQEPYSLAMLLKEMGPVLNGWNIKIYATDISTEILDNARKGIYSQFEVQRGLPIQMLMKYFDQSGDSWTIKDDIRKMVRYEYFNLLEDMSKLDMFDVIFCRNVLIYFDEATKKMVLEKMSKKLEGDGFLVLGGAETVLGITDAFKLAESYRGLYVLKNGTFDAKELAVAI